MTQLPHGSGKEILRCLGLDATQAAVLLDESEKPTIKLYVFDPSVSILALRLKSWRGIPIKIIRSEPPQVGVVCAGS